MRRAYRALSFDGDGTLWDLEAAMHAGLEDAARLLQSAGLTHAGAAVTADWLREVRDAVARLDRGRRRSMEEIRFASFEEALAQCGCADRNLLHKVYETFMDARWGRLSTYPEVPAVLSILAGRHRLALVTNGNTHPHRVSLDGLFDTVILAAECGYAKPDPAIYSQAVHALGLDPTDLLHIGDDPLEDVAAARSAGMDTVWVNRRGTVWPGPGAPTYAVTDLRELDAVLAR